MTKLFKSQSMNYKFFLIPFFLICTISFVHSQSSTDSIQIVRKNGLKFSQHGKILKPAELLTIMKPNSEAYTIMKKAKGSRDIGTIIGSVGGFMVGWSIGGLIGKGEIDTKLLIAGGALVIASIPFGSSYNSNATKAVNTYNDGLSNPMNGGAFLEIHTNENGIGLRIS